MASWPDGGYECCADDDLVGFLVAVRTWKRTSAVSGLANFFFLDLMNGVVSRTCFRPVAFLSNHLHRPPVLVDSFLQHFLNIITTTDGENVRLWILGSGFVLF